MCWKLVYSTDNPWMKPASRGNNVVRKHQRGANTTSVARIQLTNGIALLGTRAILKVQSILTAPPAFFNNWPAAISRSGLTRAMKLLSTHQGINTMTTLINITSVPADKLEATQLQVVARWKSTEKRTIPATNAVRAVTLPASIWQADTALATVTDKSLALFVLDGVADLAKDYLSTIVEESNWQRTQVPQEHFTLSALLAWQSEQAALSGRLNGEEIKKWLESSATVKSIATKHGEKIASALGEQFVKLASPNHGLTPEKASKILANIWDASDSDSTTGLRVQLRLTAISKKSAEQANMLDSIL
jgi:hypothetical protein